MSDALSSTGYQMFQDLSPRLFKQALFLLYFYPYILITEQGIEAQQHSSFARGLLDRPDD